MCQKKKKQRQPVLKPTANRLLYTKCVCCVPRSVEPKMLYDTKVCGVGNTRHTWFVSPPLQNMTPSHSKGVCGDIMELYCCKKRLLSWLQCTDKNTKHKNQKKANNKNKLTHTKKKNKAKKKSKKNKKIKNNKKKHLCHFVILC